MTSDDIIDQEDRKPPAVNTALDRHRTLRSSNDNEDEANQDLEPEISNLRVNDNETQHELLCFTGKLARKNAVFSWTPDLLMISLLRTLSKGTTWKVRVQRRNSP